MTALGASAVSVTVTLARLDSGARALSISPPPPSLASMGGISCLSAVLSPSVASSAADAQPRQLALELLPDHGEDGGLQQVGDEARAEPTQEQPAKSVLLNDESRGGEV